MTTRLKWVLAAALAILILGAGVSVALWAAGGDDEPTIGTVSTA